MGFDLMNDLGIMAIARSPDWKQQTVTVGFTGAPTGATSGVTLLTNESFAVRSLAIASPRERAHAHRSRVTISTLVIGDTYNVTITGTLVAYDSTGDADEAEVIQGISDAINANGTTNLIVVATTEQRNSSSAGVDTVVITNISGEAVTHTTVVSVTGTGVLAFDEDATTFDLRLWLLPTTGGVASAAAANLWTMPQSAAVTGIDYRGFSERIDVAGFSRIYAELTNIVNPSTVVADARPMLLHGPALLEG